MKLLLTSSLLISRQESSCMCELLQEKSMDPWGRRSHKDPNKETEVESGESIFRRYIVIKKETDFG